MRKVIKAITLPSVVMVYLHLFAQVGCAGVLVTNSCDEDAAPGAVINAPVSGAEITVAATDTWTPILTSKGIQHKNIAPDSELILVDGERPIVLDRDRDYAINYANGSIKALPGGRMEIGQASTTGFKYSYQGPASVEGKVGRAWKFDGVDDYAEFGVLPHGDVLKAITISLWIRLDKDVLFEAVIISKIAAERNGGSSYGLGLSNGRLQFFHQTVSTADGKIAMPTQATATLPRETWLHVQATYDGASTRLYVDSHEVASQNDLHGNLDSVGEFFVGGIRDPHFFKGMVDEIRINNLALSGEEIKRMNQ